MSSHEPGDREIEPDPVVRAYLAHVDRTLIARNLSLTPEERIQQLIELQRLAAELQRAGRAAANE